MSLPSQSQFEASITNAVTDATALGRIVNDAASEPNEGQPAGTVTLRLGAVVKNLRRLLVDIEASAAEAAALGGTWFADAAAGLAATDELDVFRVFDSAEAALLIYRKVDGEAVLLGAIEGTASLNESIDAVADQVLAAQAAADTAQALANTFGAGLQDSQNALPALTTGGSATAYTITPPVARDELLAGQAFRLRVHATNTGSATLKVGAFDAATLRAVDSSNAKAALGAGELRIGSVVDVVYDGTDFILVRARPATGAEAEAGTGEGPMTAALTKAAIDNQVPALLNASGEAPLFGCRAWANFNGTTGAVRASGNVTSVTKNATGDYTVNFDTAMPDANYAVSVTATDDGLSPSISPGFSYGQLKAGANGLVRATGSVRFQIGYPANSALYDQSDIHVLIFR